MIRRWVRRRPDPRFVVTEVKERTTEDAQASRAREADAAESHANLKATWSRTLSARQRVRLLEREAELIARRGA